MNSIQIFAAQDELGSLVKSMNGDQQGRFIVESLSNDEEICQEAIALCKRSINHEDVDLGPITDAAYAKFRAICEMKEMRGIHPDQPTVHLLRKAWSAYKMCTDMLSKDPYHRAMAATARNESAGLSLYHQILIARRILHEMPALP